MDQHGRAGKAPLQGEQHLGREEAKNETTRRQQPVSQENLLLDPAQAQHCFVCQKPVASPLLEEGEKNTKVFGWSSAGGSPDTQSLAGRASAEPLQHSELHGWCPQQQGAHPSQKTSCCSCRKGSRWSNRHQESTGSDPKVKPGA